MNSKEIFEDLLETDLEAARCSEEDDKIIQSKIDHIEKELDVLDLLKSSIYRCDIHKYVLKEELRGQNFMILSIHINGNENIDKIEEWMKNDK